jgi:ferrous iron transport protein A
MMTTGFSVQGSSLKLLRSQERGVITRITALRDITAQNLRKMGIIPGQSITIEQRFPRFVVRVGSNRHTLDDSAVAAIYVRIVER